MRRGKFGRGCGKVTVSIGTSPFQHRRLSSRPVVAVGVEVYLAYSYLWGEESMFFLFKF